MSPDRSHRRPSRPAVGAALTLLGATCALVAVLSLVPRTSEAQQPGADTVAATCKDGSAYRGASRQGACSGRGGVKAWGDSTAAPRPRGATAQCKDGSWHTGTARRGACAGHGGVKEWVKPKAR